MTEISQPACRFEDHPQMKLIDTTGAFSAKMLENIPYNQALEFSNKAGFLCITKFGAGPSIPTK